MSAHALLHALALALISSAGHAQDGRIVERHTFAADRSIVTELQSTSPETLNTIERVQMEEITYLSDGLKVKGFLLSPKRAGRHPVIIYNRGGCKNFGSLSQSFVARWLTEFADWGYVVVASQYRGNAGGEGKDEFGGRDVNDVMSLLPLIDSLPQADGSRIGMFSESRGGIMAYLTLARTDRMRAAIMVSTPGDLKRAAESRKKRRPDDDFEQFCLRDTIPDYDSHKDRQLADRSPMKWPEKLSRTTPILLFQGASDWRSDPQQALEMATILLRLKRPFRLVMFEGGSHDLAEHMDEVDRISREWFDFYVRDKRTPPNPDPDGH